MPRDIDTPVLESAMAVLTDFQINAAARVLPLAQQGLDHLDRDQQNQQQETQNKNFQSDGSSQPARHRVLGSVLAHDRAPGPGETPARIPSERHEKAELFFKRMKDSFETIP